MSTLHHVYSCMGVHWAQIKSKPPKDFMECPRNQMPTQLEIFTPQWRLPRWASAYNLKAACRFPSPPQCWSWKLESHTVESVDYSQIRFQFRLNLFVGVLRTCLATTIYTGITVHMSINIVAKVSIQKPSLSKVLKRTPNVYTFPLAKGLSSRTE